jgi:hypothetical protein
MRIQDPRRILRWGVLLAALCIVPIQSSTAFAKPFSWDNYDPNNPTAPSGGDGDGVVVKSAQLQPYAAAATTTTSTTTATVSATRTNWGLLRNVLLAMRLGYSLRLW